mmetsp:Transcript_46306/g.104972  ORF Transcript_46306/g.104972 Transcript_46306/m.104972 type:complete len:273 (-) Transcript_46306:187-1005(-)
MASPPGSASPPPESYSPGTVAVKNTFLEVGDEEPFDLDEELPTKTLKRTSSWAAGDAPEPPERQAYQVNLESIISASNSVRASPTMVPSAEPDLPVGVSPGQLAFALSGLDGDDDDDDDGDEQQQQQQSNGDGEQSYKTPEQKAQEHKTGDCRPCAFHHTKGCSNGDNCVYCHLCPPGELKRRKAIKRDQLRAQEATRDRESGRGPNRARRPPHHRHSTGGYAGPPRRNYWEGADPMMFTGAPQEYVQMPWGCPRPPPYGRGAMMPQMRRPT